MTTPEHSRAAARLMHERETLARAVTDALYAREPALLERYGEGGRAKCLQDMHYTIEHLIPAVDLADESMFTRYVSWLDDLLRARNVPTRDLVQCLELLRDECARRFAEDEGVAVSRIVDAGLSAVAA